ncbi:DUF5691 domain-containing protein [Herbidospora solisilvae]|uniref:DUF5691 domain-containing protein n=1 Tax=Herbidospora solisilvae TaxID=2696284 RepID=UPI002E28F922|nr:DUF5691 domain-containing protein [Herbidospora solisilvae]
MRLDRRTGWNELVSTALVGTERRGLGTPFDLLEQAAAQVVARRAGEQPGGAIPLAEAPADDAPPVSAQAADRLARLLGGEFARVLPEWLGLAARRSSRVPARLLPQLLAAGARDRSIRADLAVVAGARGRWLAGLNPDWGYLLQESSGGAPAQAGLDHGPWEFGTRGDRQAFLAALRAASPDEARDLLEVTWPKENPDDRAVFVAVLADGLTMADEPFLEKALDDRRREVRQAAADLLTKLPDSRLGQRMAVRAAALLTRDGARLTAVAPTACDSVMERDGVRSRPPAGTGPRSWWLQQVVAHTPLRFWPGHLGAEPAELVRMTIGDWAREIHMGWIRAAILQDDPVWARALFDVEPLTDLLAVLPPDERSWRAAEIVRAGNVDGQLIMMLGGVPGPWSGPLAAAVLQRVADIASSQPWNAGELARLAGERLDPTGTYDLDQLPDIGELRTAAALLRFRSDMIKEFS